MWFMLGFAVGACLAIVISVLLRDRAEYEASVSPAVSTHDPPIKKRTMHDEPAPLPPQKRTAFDP